MIDYLFPPPLPPSLGLLGQSRRLAVNRIFCVGRNYAAHAAEMGSEVDREAPFYFTKSPAAVLESGAVLAYPPGTQDLHHEIELVVALGAPAFRVGVDQAMQSVLAYGSGLDMTRRDLQAAAKTRQRPWDLGKDFHGAAVLSDLTPAAGFSSGGQQIHLSVNGTARQQGRVSDMVWSIPELIADLSQYYQLVPGDLIMTGTPAGVGPVVTGDTLSGGVEGLSPVSLSIGPAL